MEPIWNDYSFLEQIKYIPLMGKEETKEHFKQLELLKNQKDTHNYRIIREKIISCNLRLVLFIANKFSKWNIPLIDLFQEGCVYLAEAVDSYDLKKDVLFSTYAMSIIYNKYINYVRKNSHRIHISDRRWKDFFEFSKMKEKLYSQMGKEPSIELMAKELNRSIKWIEKLILDFSPVDSLDRQITENLFLEDSVIKEDIEDDLINHIIAEQERKIIQSALNVLNEKERFVMTYYYGLNNHDTLNIIEIGNALGLTKQAVSSLKINSFAKLKSLILCKCLPYKDLNEILNCSLEELHIITNMKKYSKVTKLLKKAHGSNFENEFMSENIEDKEIIELCKIYDSLMKYLDCLRKFAGLFLEEIISALPEEIYFLKNILSEKELDLLELVHGQDLDEPFSYEKASIICFKTYCELISKIKSKYIEEIRTKAHLLELKNYANYLDNKDLEDNIILIWYLNGLGIDCISQKTGVSIIKIKAIIDEGILDILNQIKTKTKEDVLARKINI